MRYREKPVFVVAHEWHPGKQIKGVCDCSKPKWWGEPRIHIHTPEGARCVNPGDMIVTEECGRVTPMSKDEFQRKYEPIGLNS